MNVFVPPETVNQNGRSSEDELDGLLRAFFQAELPHPWPSPEQPALRNAILPMRSPVRRFPMLRSRLALAASVALLVAGPLALSAYFTGGNNGGPDNSGRNGSNTATATHQAPGGPGETGFELIQKDGVTWIKVDGKPGK
jgi:hypothetical protein